MRGLGLEEWCQPAAATITHARMRDLPMGKHLKLTDERKKVFLDHLRVHGLVIHAAKAASPHSPQGAVATFKQNRQKDEVFAAAWADALAEAEENIMKEMHRRGIEGVQEDVYGSLPNNGGTGIVGTKRVYSDRILELFSRVQSQRVSLALNSKNVALSGHVTTSELGLDKLSAKQQRLLEELLSDEQED